MTSKAVYRRTGDGATYSMIPKDVDIMARALWGESGSTPSERHASAVLWCWLNRFMLHPARDKHWRYLYELIEDHSQPVNPLWRRGGPKCSSEKYKNSIHCEERDLVKRDKLANTPYAKIPKACRTFAERMSAGTLPQLFDPTNVDFATNAVAKKYGTQFVSGGQWYLNKKQTIQAGLMQGWLPGTVVLDSSSVSDSGQGLGTVLAIGVWILMTGWAVTRLT